MAIEITIQRGSGKAPPQKKNNNKDAEAAAIGFKLRKTRSQIVPNHAIRQALTNYRRICLLEQHKPFELSFVFVIHDVD